MKNVKPLFFASVLFAFVLVLLYRRVGNDALDIWIPYPFNADILIVILYLGWLIFESTITKKEVKQGSRTSDYGTCELYALGQGLTLISALWFKSRWLSLSPAHIFGLLVFCSGVMLRIWAVQTLGKYYSHIVREIEGHKIITAGPYRVIRHPAYAGMLTANAGVAIFFFNIATSLILLLLLFPAIVLRIMVEGKTLVRIEGYQEQMGPKKRLIPFIW